MRERDIQTAEGNPIGKERKMVGAGQADNIRKKYRGRSMFRGGQNGCESGVSKRCRIFKRQRDIQSAAGNQLEDSENTEQRGRVKTMRSVSLAVECNGIMG